VHHKFILYKEPTGHTQCFTFYPRRMFIKFSQKTHYSLVQYTFTVRYFKDPNSWCAVGSEFRNVIWPEYNRHDFVPCIKLLVAGLPSRRPGLDPLSFCLRFVLGRVALEWVFVDYFLFPISMIN